MELELSNLNEVLEECENCLQTYHSECQPPQLLN